MGKTQIAVEYAHRHLDEYVYALWANAHSREALVSGYVTIAGLLKLPEADSQDRTLAVEAVKRWLSIALLVPLMSRTVFLQSTGGACPIASEHPNVRELL